MKSALLIAFSHTAPPLLTDAFSEKVQPVHVREPFLTYNAPPKELLPVPIFFENVQFVKSRVPAVTYTAPLLIGLSLLAIVQFRQFKVDEA